MTDEDEDKLWQRFTEDIKPIKKTGAKKPPAPTAAPKKKSAVPTKPAERIDFSPGLKSPLPAKPKEPPQLDKRTDEKLRKGKMPIDATLDLHGLTQGAAHEALQDFIQRTYKTGKRCVLVITGKGLSKRTAAEWMEPTPGVLKQRLPQWLAETPLKDIVLKYYPAQAAHGGSGAFYVYLKRKR